MEDHGCSERPIVSDETHFKVTGYVWRSPCLSTKILAATEHRENNSMLQNELRVSLQIRTLWREREWNF